MSFVKLDSALEYKDEIIGEGKEAEPGLSSVTVHYTGWLQNPDGTAGYKIDCSRERNEPFTFPLGMQFVIAGWEEGIKGMKVGGRRILRIPSDLAYGAMGAGEVVPPYADLVFDIELLDTQ